MINAVMITKDRAPAKNYLLQSLKSLASSDYERCLSLTVCDQSVIKYPETFAHKAVGKSGLKNVLFTYTDARLSANENVANALTYAANLSGSWVLFLEDDITVGPRFFESTALWLDDHMRPDRYVYPLCANYPPVLQRTLDGYTAWDYPIRQFYGTQAFAIRPQHALDLAAYIRDDPYRVNRDGTAWDLIMHEWALSRWPDIAHFLTPCPSFIQHAGRASLVNPRAHTHVFPSFDPDYNYAAHRLAMAMESECA